MSTEPTEYRPCVTVAMGHLWPTTQIEVTEQEETGTHALTLRSGGSYLVLHARREGDLRRLAHAILDALPAESDGTA